MIGGRFVGPTLEWLNRTLGTTFAGADGETGSGALVRATSATLVTPGIGSQTWAGKTAAGTAGRLTFLSNVGTKGSLWLDDGTRWKPVNGIAVLASKDSASANVNGSETVVFQYQLPAAFWQVGDIIRITGILTKSGTTNTGVLNVRIGTAGTTGDTGPYNVTWLTAANRWAEQVVDLRLEDATHVQVMSNPYIGTANSAAFAASTAISNVSNSLYVSVTITGGATDSVALQGGRIEYLSAAN